MASPAEVLANFPTRSPQSSSSKRTVTPQIYVPRHWRCANALNSIAGRCCASTVHDVIKNWLTEGHPLSDIVAQFALECICHEHSPFCPNGVVSKYREQDGVVDCVQFIATHTARPNKIHEIRLWAESMIRHNEHSLLALVLKKVPEAREGIGRALQTTWKTLEHLKLYHAALKYGSISLDSELTHWLLNTRMTQPWPQRFRYAPEAFEEASAHSELARITLYFENKVGCRALPKFAQWKIIKEVIWLTVSGENRPALPQELVALIFQHVPVHLGQKSIWD